MKRFLLPLLALCVLFSGFLPTAATAQSTPSIVHLSAWPNPVQVGEGTDVIMDIVGGPASVELSIVGEGTNTAVWSLPRRQYPELRNTIRWDGRNSQGQLAGAGHYEVVARLENNGRVTTIRGTYALIIRGEGGVAPPTAQPTAVPTAVPSRINRQMVVDSYRYAFGRSPSDPEVAYWLGLPSTDSRAQSVDTLVASHRQYLQQEQGERDATARRAIEDALGVNATDSAVSLWSTTLRNSRLVHRELRRRIALGASYVIAFGRQPTAGETDFWLQQPETDQLLIVAGMVRRHREYLAANQGARHDVIRLAVRSALGRNATDADVAAWDEAVRLEYTYRDVVHRMVIAQAFVQVAGREPYAEEWAYWLPVFDSSEVAMDRSVPGAIGAIRERWIAQSPPEELLDTINRVYRTTLNREPTELDVETMAFGIGLFGWTFADASQFAIIYQSYLDALGRAPSNDEILYWWRVDRSDPRVRSVASLVQAHRDWLESAITSYSPEQIGTLPVTSLRDAGLDRLNLQQVTGLSASQLETIVAELTPTQIGALSIDQVQALSAGRVGSIARHLRAAQVAWLTSTQVRGLGADQLREAGARFLTPQQIAALTPETLTALGIETLAPIQLHLITPDHVTRIGPSRFTPEQVGAINAQTFLAVGAARFSADQVERFAQVQSKLIGMDGATLIGMDGATVVGNNGTGIVAAGGGNIVAAGAGNIIGTGGAGIVAAGGGNIVAAGAGNVVGNAGGSIVAAGGGNIVAAGAGNIVAAGGGNIVGNAGSNVIVNNGGNIVAAGAGNLVPLGVGGLAVAPSASGLVATPGTPLIGMDGASVLARGMNGGELGQLQSQLASAGLTNRIVAAGAGNIVAAGGGN
jgi:hypothetical protein